MSRSSPPKIQDSDLEQASCPASCPPAPSLGPLPTTCPPASPANHVAPLTPPSPPTHPTPALQLGQVYAGRLFRAAPPAGPGLGRPAGHSAVELPGPGGRQRRVQPATQPDVRPGDLQPAGQGGVRWCAPGTGLVRRARAWPRSWPLLPGRVPSPPCLPLPTPAGAIGTNPSWYNTSAFAGARPTTAAGRGAAGDMFAAHWGELPAVPRRIVALYSPRITFRLRLNDFKTFITYWQAGGPGLVRGGAAGVAPAGVSQA